MAELCDVLTAGFWSRISIAVGDAVRQSNWFDRCSDLPSEMADCDHGDFCHVDVSNASRPDQYAVVGRSADGFVFLGNWTVRDDASDRKSLWC